MPFGRSYKMARLHGSHVGALAERVYVCQACHGWQVDTKGKPVKPDFFCTATLGCNSTQFHHFPSKTEARAFGTLLIRQRAGEIADIELQPRFKLHAIGPAGERVELGAYVGDFRFRVVESGEIRIVDVKGDADTHMSAWKRKHAEAEYGIVIGLMRT